MSRAYDDWEAGRCEHLAAMSGPELVAAIEQLLDELPPDHERRSKSPIA
jgi:hypothetical protein